jgi:hypothetical protein
MASMSGFIPTVTGASFVAWGDVTVFPITRVHGQEGWKAGGASLRPQKTQRFELMTECRRGFVMEERRAPAAEYRCRRSHRSGTQSRAYMH